MSRALVIIAVQGYQDVELAGTLKGLGDKGYSVTIGSSAPGTCTGKFGGKTKADISLKEAKISDYDRIAFIGGPGAEAYARNPEALRIAHDAAAASLPLGAICIAPLILAKAHVLDGKRATVWDSGGEQKAILEEYGASYTGETVTCDGLIVTGNGPEAAEEFGRTLVALTRR